MGYSGISKADDSKGVLDTGFKNPDSAGADILSRTMDGVSTDFMLQSYQINPWIRATVDKIIARVNVVDIFPKPLDLGSDAPKKATSGQAKKMEKIQTLFNRPNRDFETMDSIKSKLLKDLLIWDNAGMEIVFNGPDNVQLFCNAAGRELFPNVDKNGHFISEEQAYIQIQKKKKVAAFTKQELMYFAKNRFSGRTRGFSPIESIALQISADLFADKYNIDFFSNNAKPNIAFLFENLGFGNGQNAIRRAKDWYLQEFQGNPHLPLFMGAEKGAVKLQQLQISNKDMEFQAYTSWMLSKIMAVYGMQPFILGIISGTTGKLNSVEQTEQFKIDAVLPYLKLYTDTLNRVLIWGDDNFNFDDIFLVHDTLDLKDEAKTAETYQTYLKNGVITINQVRQELQMAPAPWGHIPYIPVNLAPLGGAAPNRIPDGGDPNAPGVQNPAAADPNPAATTEKYLKKMAVQDLVKKWAGVKYVKDSKIMDAIDKIIKGRESQIHKAYSFSKAGEVDYSSLGTIGHKSQW